MPDVFRQQDIENMDPIEMERLARKLREETTRMIALEFDEEPTQAEIQKIMPGVFLFFSQLSKALNIARDIGRTSDLRKLRKLCHQLQEEIALVSVAAKAMRSLKVKDITSLADFISRIPSSKLQDLIGASDVEWPEDLDSLFDDFGLDGKNPFNRKSPDQ